MMELRQQGFSLLSAIFLITILAALGAFLLIMSGVAQQTPILGLNGAQAYHAARSGLEWGIAQAVNNGAGGNATVCDGTFALDQYTVTVSCEYTDHTDDGVNVQIYRIVAVATTGTVGNFDYASRTLRGIASPQGPQGP